MGAGGPSPSFQLPNAFQLGTFASAGQGSDPSSLAACANLQLPVCGGGREWDEALWCPPRPQPSCCRPCPAWWAGSTGQSLELVLARHEVPVLRSLPATRAPSAHKLFAPCEFGMMSPLSSSAWVLARAAPPAPAGAGSCHSPRPSRDLPLPSEQVAMAMHESAAL